MLVVSKSIAATEESEKIKKKNKNIHTIFNLKC